LQLLERGLIDEQEKDNWMQPLGGAIGTVPYRLLHFLGLGVYEGCPLTPLPRRLIPAPIDSVQSGVGTRL